MDNASDSSVPSVGEKPDRSADIEHAIEIIRLLILSVAALTIAWSGYQASRWGGLMSINFSQAGAMRLESTRASTAAGQVFLLDLSNFEGWLQATVAENDELAEFYLSRFRPELLTAFDAWIAMRPDEDETAPRSPFSTDAYSLSLNEQADELEQRAEGLFAEGLDANQTSDNYVLNSVVFAMALVIAGLADRFRRLWIRGFASGLSLIALVIGLINLVSFPIL